MSHKSVDTERITKMFTDNIFLLFSTKISNLAMRHPLVVATALFNFSV